jgi:hypothetical protein
VSEERRDLTPDTQVPYGPRRPSRLQVVIWSILVLALLVPVAILVYAVVTRFGHGIDNAVGLTAFFA